MFATILSVISPASVLSKVIAPKAFTEHKNLMLRSPDLAIGSHITTNNIFTIWIHEQTFVSQSDAQKWVQQIYNIETRKACYIDLILQKIRLLNIEAKTAKEILDLLKKDFIYLELEKKNTSAFQDSFASYIKAICYYNYSHLIYTIPSSAC